MITDTGNHRILEVQYNQGLPGAPSAGGVVLWSFGQPGTITYAAGGPGCGIPPIAALELPVDAERLGNGNLLVTDLGWQRVIEFRQTGPCTAEIVWECQTISNACSGATDTLVAPYDAHEIPGHLGDGCTSNLVIADHDVLDGKVWEVVHPPGYNPNGPYSCGALSVWEITGTSGLQFPFDAYVLDSPGGGPQMGITTCLVAQDSNSVREYIAPIGYSPYLPALGGTCVTGGALAWEFTSYVNGFSSLSSCAFILPPSASLLGPRDAYRVGGVPSTVSIPGLARRTLIADSVHNIAIEVDHASVPLGQTGGDITWFYGSAFLVPGCQPNPPSANGELDFPTDVVQRLPGPAFRPIADRGAASLQGNRVVEGDVAGVPGSCQAGNTRWEYGNNPGNCSSSTSFVGCLNPSFDLVSPFDVKPE